MSGAAVILLASVIAPSPARAQTDDGSALTISLITVAPGSRSWEMFGHNAIRVHDRSRGTDISYNYGMFSFEQENFILRFVQGRMLYWMAGIDTPGMLAWYSQDNRSIWEQELNLLPSQAVELRAFLEWNAKDENAYYRYDYFYDNCSTRIRDAIDRAIGGRLRRATENMPAGLTFRRHTQRLTTGNPLLYSGLLLGLGTPVDGPISAWEEMFLPGELMEHVRNVDVVAADGNAVPLVRSERLVFEGTRPPERNTPPAWLLYYLLVGVALGASIVWLRPTDNPRRAKRIGFSAVAGTWTFLSGAAGFVLLGLWTLTDHSAAYRNENLFIASPIALPLAAFMFLGLHRLRSAGRAARWLAMALAASSLIGLVIQILPGFDQVNGQLLALAVPANLGVAIAVVGAKRESNGAEW